MLSYVVHITTNQTLFILITILKLHYALFSLEEVYTEGTYRTLHNI